MAQRWQITASLCQKLGGLENRLFSMTNLHWKITPTLQQEEKEIVMRKVGYSSWMKKVLKDQRINDLISWKQNEKWKDCMMNMWKRLQREIHPFIQYNDQDNQDTNNLKDLKIIIKSMPKQDGGPVLRSHRETCRGIQHIRPRQLSGNSTTIGNRTKVGILGDPHPGLNSSDFFSSEMPFSLAGNWIPWQSTGGVDRYTCRTPHFHMYSHSTNHTAQMTCVHGSSLSCVPKIGHSSTRHVSPCFSQYIKHQHKFSLIYISCVTVVLFSEPRPVVHASSYPQWRSTAGWYFHGIPLLHSSRRQLK